VVSRRKGYKKGRDAREKETEIRRRYKKEEIEGRSRFTKGRDRM
jgi:hypothetical protein